MSPVTCVQQGLRWVVTVVLAAAASQSWAGEEVSRAGRQVFDRVQPVVYALKTSISAKSSKASYGSAFVVDRNGLLATNYHVVSQAVQEPQKYQIYLMVGPEILAAEVVGVDVRQDVAVVRVDRKFPQALSFATEPPRQGDRVYSIGIPEDLGMAITEGVFNGLVKYGPYESLHLSAPINSGMSGGPTVDSQGRIVGLNVSYLIDSNNISFAVPAKFLRAILAKPADFGGADFNKVIAAQVGGVQKQLADEFLKTAAKAEFQNWFILHPPPSLKSWSDNKDHPRGVYKGAQLLCFLSHSSFIESDLQTGAYEWMFRTMRADQKLNVPQFFNAANDVYNQGLEGDFKQRMTGPDRKVFTRYECTENLIRNAHGVMMKVNTCLRAYVRMPSLYDAEVKALVFRDGREKNVLMARGTFRGFALESIKSMVQLQIETMAPAGGRE